MSSPTDRRKSTSILFLSTRLSALMHHGAGQSNKRDTALLPRKSVAVFLFDDKPSYTYCSDCEKAIMTDAVPHIGCFNFVACIGLCCMGGCLGCCIIPFFMQTLMDVDHHCPHCGHVVGEYKQLDY